MALAFASSAAMAAKRVALVIGNAAYTNAPTLVTPKNDTQDMAAALKALGFTVILGSDLDKSGMDRKILEFEKALSGAEAGVFHYSGHGLQVAGVNYLVPVDANLESAAALRIEAVRLDFIQETMEREAKTNILFLDACRNNPLTRNLARALGTRSAEIGRGLASMESGAGTLISFSTQPGNVALDGSGRNSPYSGPLVKAIGTPGEDVLSVLTAVRNAVMATTADKQVPWDNNALRAKFYFNPVATQSEPGRPQERTSEAAQAWAEHKDTKDIAVLDAFRKQFGAANPYYDTLAAQRIEVLRSDKPAPGYSPAPAPNIKTPREPLPAEVPVDVNILSVIETSPLFANAPPVTVRSYSVGSNASWTTTNQSGTLQDVAASAGNSDTTVRWVRQGLIASHMSDDTTVSNTAGSMRSTGRSVSLKAANGLITLASSTVTHNKFGASTVVLKLLRIENVSGNIFPMELGRHFSYGTTEQVTSSNYRDEVTTRYSCEIVKKYDAKVFHHALSGSAYLLSCDKHTTYKNNDAGNSDSNDRGVFFNDLGIWVDADPVSPREQILLTGEATKTREYATTLTGSRTLKSFELAR